MKNSMQLNKYKLRSKTVTMRRKKINFSCNLNKKIMKLKEF